MRIGARREAGRCARSNGGKRLLRRARGRKARRWPGLTKYRSQSEPPVAWLGAAAVYSPSCFLGQGQGQPQRMTHCGSCRNPRLSNGASCGPGQRGGLLLGEASSQRRGSKHRTRGSRELSTAAVENAGRLPTASTPGASGRLRVKGLCILLCNLPDFVLGEQPSGQQPRSGLRIHRQVEVAASAACQGCAIGCQELGCRFRGQSLGRFDRPSSIVRIEIAKKRTVWQCFAHFNR